MREYGIHRDTLFLTCLSLECYWFHSCYYKRINLCLKFNCYFSDFLLLFIVNFGTGTVIQKSSSYFRSLLLKLYTLNPVKKFHVLLCRWVCILYPFRPWSVQNLIFLTIFLGNSCTPSCTINLFFLWYLFLN